MIRNKLKLDELQVESFHVLPDGEYERGTVLANEAEAVLETAGTTCQGATCKGDTCEYQTCAGPSCQNTFCYRTCGYTCGGSCPNDITCGGSCGPTCYTCWTLCNYPCTYDIACVADAENPQQFA